MQPEISLKKKLTTVPNMCAHRHTWRSWASNLQEQFIRRLLPCSPVWQMSLKRRKFLGIWPFEMTLQISSGCNLQFPWWQVHSSLRSLALHPPSHHLPPILQYYGRSRDYTIPVKDRPVDPISQTKSDTPFLPKTYFFSNLFWFE